MSVKYSIIIPAWNGGEYLKSCVHTIIMQDYDDYELIISDDHSTDGSKEYLSTLLCHPNISVVEPEKSLSMTEHWEWALSHANGTWQIFVGQDDGLQPYFFKLADRLTEIAERNQVRTIMSERAFYFWPGCEPQYGDISVGFNAYENTRLHHSFYEALKALLGIQNYFELPQMYTTSLFHKSILNEARQKQFGKVLTCHPQDANLGVIACSLDAQYLKSSIPLGWVGTSVKSAGLSISMNKENFSGDELKGLEKTRKAYVNKVSESSFKFNHLAGDFAFGDIPVYFWQAFLETPELRSKKINDFLCSFYFKYLLFSSVKLRLILKRKYTLKKNQFDEILERNSLSSAVINSVAVIICCVVLLMKIFYFILRVYRRFMRCFPSSKIRVYYNRSDNATMTMEKASRKVLEKTQEKRWFL